MPKLDWIGKQYVVERLLEALEDLEDLRAADEALAEIERGEDELIPWEQAKREVDEERRQLREQGKLAD